MHCELKFEEKKYGLKSLFQEATKFIVNLQEIH